MARRRRIPKRNEKDTTIDSYENCRIRSQRRQFLVSGKVNLECENGKYVGKQNESYTKFVGASGKCRVIGESTKTTLDDKVSDYKLSDGEIILTNLQGLIFRSRSGKIFGKDFEKRGKKILSEDAIAQFDCGCINDKRQFKKEVEHKYFPMVKVERGVYQKEKNQGKQWYPTSWIKKYVEVDDKIFDNKTSWMSEKDFNSKKSVLNRNEMPHFKKTGRIALGCIPIKDDMNISSKIPKDSYFVPQYLNSKEPYIFLNGTKMENKKGEAWTHSRIINQNFACQLKSKVPALSTIEIQGRKINKGDIISLESAKKKFKGFDFNYQIESYYNPQDLRKDFARVGYQCTAIKPSRGFFSKVSMKMNDPQLIN